MTLNVTVYSKPRCQQCVATKRWLKDKGIKHTVEDITEPGNAAAVAYLGYLQAPVTVWTDSGPGGEQHFSGFNPTELDRILEAARKAP